MTLLLETLGFAVDERTRRAPCRLHCGSNPTAFSWREDGCWHCHSCGEGGDRISLVRSARRCSFRESVEFLAGLAGVDFRSRRVSRQEIAQAQRLRHRAESAAWRIADEIGRLRRYYTDGLHRAEWLQRRVGSMILRSSSDAARDAEWEKLARLAPVCTFFFAAWNFVWNAKPDTLARFVLASPTERRQFVVGAVAP